MDKARDAVHPAIEVLADLDIPSPPFEALLGPRKAMALAVTDLLEKIRDFKGIAGKKPYSWGSKPPEFICVHSDTIDRWKDLEELNPYKFCQEFPDAWAFGSDIFRFVFICERFWGHKDEPPPRPKSQACPRVIDNKWVDADGERLLSFQKYLIDHELIHQYIHDGGLSKSTDPKEEYGLNECTMLTPGNNRFNNPNNVAFFIASKLLSLNSSDGYLLSRSDM